MLTIRSRSHDYSVEDFASLREALEAVSGSDRACYLVDRKIAEIHRDGLGELLPPGRTILIDASEKAKSFEALTGVFLSLLELGIRRDGNLVVVGGGVLQDIGCFIASVLFRGVRWELVPTTLLAQADSCIGSKSSINIGSFKNQIGTFYPPHRVLMATDVLSTLPWDEIRSGLGEVIKLQLLDSEQGFRELMDDLGHFHGEPGILAKWVNRSMAVKKPYIEADEFDRGPRNLLNYGHTFGHAYESAANYGIPHGIAVVLGILTATSLSARLGLVDAAHSAGLRKLLAPWFLPYQGILRQAPRDVIFRAIGQDKKNTGTAVNSILTHGFGKMEKMPVSMGGDLIPAVNHFIDHELNDI